MAWKFCEAVNGYSKVMIQQSAYSKLCIQHNEYANLAKNAASGIRLVLIRSSRQSFKLPVRKWDKKATLFRPWLSASVATSLINPALPLKTNREHDCL